MFDFESTAWNFPVVWKTLLLHSLIQVFRTLASHFRFQFDVISSVHFNIKCAVNLVDYWYDRFYSPGTSVALLLLSAVDRTIFTLLIWKRISVGRSTGWVFMAQKISPGLRMCSATKSIGALPPSFSRRNPFVYFFSFFLFCKHKN